MGRTSQEEFDFDQWATGGVGQRVDPPSVRERLMAAVDYLATSDSDISTRLAMAYRMIGLDRENELPENLRADYRKIVERITRKKAHADGESVIVVARSIRGKKATQAAAAIVRLHRRLEAQSAHHSVSNFL